MKRNGVVLNAREVRTGRRLLRQVQEIPSLAKQASALLGRGPAFAARFAKAAEMTAYEGVISDVTAALIVKAAANETEASRLAAEHEADGWLSLARAIRYIIGSAEA